MTKARDLGDLLDTSGDVKSGSLDNVSVNDSKITAMNASKLTGTVADARISTLTASKLTGALPSIDGSSLTGVEAFPAGTKLTFYQASAPTGWTQDTTASLANRSLRIVTGSGGGTGGTHDLSSPPSLAHTHTGASHTHSGAAHTHSHSLSAGAHTLSTSQMPSHTHSYSYHTTNQNYASGIGKRDSQPAIYQYRASASTGGGASHSHSLSGSISSGGSGATGAEGTGATSSTTPTAFAPKYVDVILASKD